ncbi:MAG: asparagine synthase (glutamine-hydrolyzing) [Planctomycetota bacterium]
MCGILGEVAPAGTAVERTEAQIAAWLAEIEHRGPDGQGIWRAENVLFGHARLAVRDPENPAADQPMVTPCGRYALSYVGELYEERSLRDELEPEVRARTGGRGFATTCDAETVLWALAIRGPEVVDELRGMFAFAFVDLAQRTLHLARDPLGVKPLVWARTSRGIAFASEPRALVSHPEVRCAPDLEMVAAYLATSRRTLAGRTMFEGVESLRPGDLVRVDLCDARPAPVRVARRTVRPIESSPDAAECRRVIEDSTRRHLVSDVSLCALLSGGLDSTILTTIVAGERPDLATWCAAGIEGGQEIGPDPRAARSVAAHLGTVHTDVAVDRSTFVHEWEALVGHLLQPLSTPNEVALSETARAIRRSGAAVAISGEGADELFGGYDSALAAFATHGSLADPPIGPARFHLEATAWASPAAQDELLVPELASASTFVIDTYERGYRECVDRIREGGAALEAHLRLQRAFNLTALLERLDAATMRFGVEGRTPFADVVVASYADGLPMSSKFDVADDGAIRSKIVLREAFGGVVPGAAGSRPKASFPIPFERWSASMSDRIGASPFLAELVQRPALEAVAAEPHKHWKLAWLFANLALFGAAAFESERSTLAGAA